MENTQLQQHLTNSLIDLTIHQKPYCVIEFVVKALPPLVQEAHKKAIKAVSKEVSLPGFRKGKAPEQLVAKNFSADIDKRWQQVIGEDAFRECELLAKIPVLNSDSRIRFAMKSHSLDGADMTFSFESEPQTPAIDIQALSLTPVPKEAVSEEKIADTLDKIRLFFAQWNPVNDRAVQEKDFIVFDVESLETDPPEKVLSNSRAEVGSLMTKWLKEAVLGMQVGESKETISAPDESSSEEDKENFAPKRVRLTLNAIEEAILPAVDDDFAKRIGADTAELMRQRLNTLLNKQAEEAQRAIYRDQLCYLLLEKYPFEVPGSLLHSEIQHRFQQLFQKPSFRKKYEQFGEEEKKQEFEKIKQHAEEAIRLFYLCKKVAIDNNIPISPNDLNQDVHSILEAMFADKELLKPNKTEEEKNLLLSKLLLAKAQDFIIDRLTQ